MATMLMCKTMMDIDFSYSTTSTTPTTTTSVTPTSSADDVNCYYWNDLSPVVDWGELSDNRDDFQELMESMIDHDTSHTTVYHHDSMIDHDTSHTTVYHNNDDKHILERCDSTSVVSPETLLMDVEDNINTTTTTTTTTAEEDAKGLRLVHLLMAAAEALTGINKSRDLARVILVRLKELVTINDGTNIERLAAYFSEALHGLLDGAASGVNNSKQLWSNNNGLKDDQYKSDVLAAFQLLQDMSPYVKFGHFTANQAILEAVANNRRIHIVDYDIMEGIQWASLMESLVSRNNGTLTPHLRITALSRGGVSGRQSFGTIQQTGRRLIDFAKSIGLPFSFQQCRLDSDEKFRPSGVKLARGETVIVNCMLHLPHSNYRAPDSIASFLSGVKELKPRLITLVEQEVNPTSEEGFVGNFMESLHHYSAMYDSLEAGFPMQGQARALVERVFLGPQITASIAQIYRANAGEESCSWGERLAAMGFCPNTTSFSNHCQAKLLLGLFNHGYRVEELENNKLVLGWKSRRLLSASIWTCQDIE